MTETPTKKRDQRRVQFRTEEATFWVWEECRAPRRLSLDAYLNAAADLLALVPPSRDNAFKRMAAWLADANTSDSQVAALLRSMETRTGPPAGVDTTRGSLPIAPAKPAALKKAAKR